MLGPGACGRIQDQSLSSVKKAQKRRLSLSEPELPNPPEQLPPQKKPEPPEQPPPEQPPQPLPERRPRKRPAPLLEPQESAQDGVEACCASCQNYFPGVMLPSQRRCRWLCPDCRAQRRDFNREQRYFKKWKPSLERDPGGFSGSRRRKQLGKVKEKKKPGRPPKHPSARARSSVCGECEACLLKADCGRCDFCRDKPKFGGENLKRQKCRWRQCLRFAMVPAGVPLRMEGRGLAREVVVLDPAEKDEEEEERTPVAYRLHLSARIMAQTSVF
ncbi:Methyl-CpG-binding domain protein 1 [Chelonia mydas]|uniref:Methyl-CpG-binding domain protein 1 n=1 Tax=Chelonia mydas TaxID=8469 RepID=M7AUA6_CHEMY|nr:Methyl-CpG-binding domain protein 1 [Chelonia mydas]